MSISNLVNDCLAKFKATQAEAAEKVLLSRTSMAGSEFGSLQYRLRDASNLEATTTSLLQDLLGELDSFRKLCDTDPRTLGADTVEARPSTPKPFQLEEYANNENDIVLFGLEHESSFTNRPLVRSLEEIHEVIACLLRFNMALRNPARHDQIKHLGTSLAKHFEQYDIAHVCYKYPTARKYLHERLGKAISRHRQYFKYREEHHVKLSEGLDERDSDDEERPSTIATSLREVFVSTAAPHLHDLPKFDMETESVYTATSYASTSFDTKELREPSTPEAGLGGEPFECPLSYRIITAEDETSWSRRRDWQRHQTQTHNRMWTCAFCSAELESEAEFQEHLIEYHNYGRDPQVLQTITDACVVSSGKIYDLLCPLCQKSQVSSERLIKHVGHHLQQLALHALPQRFTEPESEEDDHHGILIRDGEESAEASHLCDGVPPTPDIARPSDDTHEDPDVGSALWIPEVRLDFVKGRTRIPKRIVKASVLHDLGLGYEEDSNSWLLNVALSKPTIDSILERSHYLGERIKLCRAWIEEAPSDLAVAAMEMPSVMADEAQNKR
ncbi:hypothetical protein LTR37_007679 [Vermiconidia calcicola]|uniref:Uncharacterized protein n=1 Tax=Vermiconidia calcicola TaxID=1690605 RepID=A0ACC3ND58_9PEZI|nr:hypothetical protein LTR37_007679 [Vermiconidia calcicola]